MQLWWLNKQVQSLLDRQSRERTAASAIVYRQGLSYKAFQPIKSGPPRIIALIESDMILCDLNHSDLHTPFITTLKLVFDWVTGRRDVNVTECLLFSFHPPSTLLQQNIVSSPRCPETYEKGNSGSYSLTWENWNTTKSSQIVNMLNSC